MKKISFKLFAFIINFAFWFIMIKGLLDLLKGGL